MTNDLSVKQMCLVIRSGAEIWIDEAKAIRIGNDLENITVKFLIVEGRFINVSDIVGLFLPIDLEEIKNRKRGMWKCKYNKWHGKDDECICGGMFGKYNRFEPPVVNKVSEKTLEDFRKNKEKLGLI